MVRLMVNPALEQLQEYPFGRLANLIKDLTPPVGVQPIVMSIGEPQDQPPPFVPEILAREAVGWGRYPPPAGTPELRQAIADWLTRRYNLPAGMLDAARHLFPVAGTREALFDAATVVVDPATRSIVLLPNPFYQVYVGAAVVNGAQPQFLPAERRNGFLPDFSLVSEATWKRTALVYLCTPANPQGATASLDYLKELIATARRHGAVVAIDECYAEIYRDTPPAGGLQAARELHGAGASGDPFANVLVFHSLSKRSSAPGLRSGFVAGDARLIEMVARLRSYGGSSIPTPIMTASAALWREEKHVAVVRARYNANFEAAAQILHNRFGFFRPAGGFFLWLDVGDGERATRALWEKGALKVLPGKYLSRGEGEANPGRNFVRVALVHDLPTTREAMQRFAAIL